jgi:hypothetical protein
MPKRYESPTAFRADLTTGSAKEGAWTGIEGYPAARVLRPSNTEEYVRYAEFSYHHQCELDRAEATVESAPCVILSAYCVKPSTP